MKKLIIGAVFAPLAVGLAACDVDQTKEGELPAVEVEGGELPEFDVETAEVDVGTKTTTVEVPDVDVKMPSDAEGAPVTGDE